MVDAADRDAPYLTPGFVQHIDQLLHEMRQLGGGGYDPFLLAQDIFAHPYRPETWIVLTDWATSFPGREAQGQIAGPVWEPLL